MRRSKLITTAVIGQQSLFNEGLVAMLTQQRYHVKLRGYAFSSAVAAKIAQLGIVLCVTVCDDLTDVALDAFIRVVRCSNPSCSIVMLSKECPTERLGSLLHAGANAWLPLTIRPEGLINALDLVVSNQVNVAVFEPAQLAVERFGDAVTQTTAEISDRTKLAALAPELGPLRRLKTLSDREKSVLEHLLKGESNKHIARALLISEATVKIHVRALLKKIGAENRTQAAVWALQGYRMGSDGDGLNGNALKN